MALSAVGLKTYIWNNNIRSLLYLLLYPLVITSSYITGISIVLFSQQMESKKGFESINFFDVLHKVIVHSWFVPYAIIFTYLLCMYLYNRNRIDVPADMTIVTRNNYPGLYAKLENLCISRGMTTPNFFIYTHDSCNAYTTGLTPGTYQIVVTSGLLKKLTDEEIEGVLAHELTHLINGDTRLIFITSTTSNMLRTLTINMWQSSDDRSTNRLDPIAIALWISLMMSRIGCFFVQIFVSKKREYIADAGAVELTKNPEALISALKKVDNHSWGFADNHLVRPALFNFKKNGIISTHPPIADRIAAITLYNRIASDSPAPWTKKAIKTAQKSQKDVVW